MSISVIAAMAQQYSVQCQVNDSEGEGVPFATIYVYNSNDTSKVITSGVSDAFGKVDHKISKAGKYMIRLQFVGMTPQDRNFEVSASAPVAQLGTIVLTTQSTMLKEVVVATQRQLVKTEIDRLTYDVQADADSRTSNVLDMLKKVPMVSVDGQDEIRVKGSTSFKVYRNGHPDPALASMNMKEILKVIPASMIKKIEVITDPGAKYDAEGTSAILNIVMADGDAGTMSGITGTVGVGVDQTGSLDGNANITAQVGKVVTSLNYGYHNQNRHSGHYMTESEHTYANSGNKLYNDNDSRAHVNVHYGELSASWEPDTVWRILLRLQRRRLESQPHERPRWQHPVSLHHQWPHSQDRVLRPAWTARLSAQDSPSRRDADPELYALDNPLGQQDYQHPERHAQLPVPLHWSVVQY